MSCLAADMWRHASMVASLPSLRQEAPWNVFDLILVILAVYDLIVSLQRLGHPHRSHRSLLGCLH